jgi:hypothetical protein
MSTVVRARPVRAIGVLALAIALWLPCLRFVYRSPPEALRTRAGGLSPLARSLLDRQIALWSASGPPQRELARMRASNPEWDLMSRTFLALALANAALREPARRDALVAVIDRVIDDTLARERAQGQRHFLLRYASASRFVDPSQRSVFVDGELALMIAARRTLRDDSPRLREELAVRTQQIKSQMERGPIGSAESYPDECWTFCNTVALAALRASDVLDHTEHRALTQRWLANARRTLVDPATGMLVSSYTLDGRVRQGPEGSSIYMAAHGLALVDPAWADDQYRRAKAHLQREWLGFGFAREWPAVSDRASADIDSGPTVPWVGANAGASGLALLGAASFDDHRAYAGLVASLDLAAFPVIEDGTRRYAASNAVGDAVLLYSLVEGPLWNELRSRGAR